MLCWAQLTSGLCLTVELLGIGIHVGSRIWRDGTVITKSCTGMETMVLVCMRRDRGEINSKGC